MSQVPDHNALPKGYVYFEGVDIESGATSYRVMGRVTDVADFLSLVSTNLANPMNVAAMLGVTFEKEEPS